MRFRHLPEGLEGEALDAYQDRLQLALEASGEAWVSTTKIRAPPTCGPAS